MIDGECAYSECTEIFWGLCRQIEVADGEVNHVGECLQIPEATGPVLDDLDDPVQPLADGISQTGIDVGNDPVTVLFEGAHKGPDGFDSAFQSGCHPTLEKPFGGPPCFVFPESLEFILEDPRTVNTAVAIAQSLEGGSLVWGTVGRMLVKEPSKPLEGFPFVSSGLAPFFLADLIHGIVHGFLDMKAVQDQSSVGAVMFDSPDVCLAHVTCGPLDARLLLRGEHLIEENVDGFPPFPLPTQTTQERLMS